MTPVPSRDVTVLLEQARQGDASALDNLLPLLYEELRRLAHRQRRARPYETLNTTALVHEAYLKLAQRDGDAWQSRLHFFRIAARAMRDVVVDYARRQQTAKRGGQGPPDKSLDEAPPLPDLEAEEVLALHEALERLEALDARQARVVELRYFVGLSIDETAQVLDLSPATVKRDWTTARAWLFRELDEKS